MRELLERLGSAAPAPGGGAAAALAGAMGAALVQMTANLSIGRPKLADSEAQARRIEAQAADLRDRLAELGDADAQAYARVSAAYKLPREDLLRAPGGPLGAPQDPLRAPGAALGDAAQHPERQQPAQDSERLSNAQDIERKVAAQHAERSMAIQAALRQAAQVPLETARLCAAVLELAEVAAPLLNRAVISDVMVGALLAQAALESAALNVDVNLAAMTNASVAEQLQHELQATRSGSAERLQRILDTARSRLSKPVAKG